MFGIKDCLELKLFSKDGKEVYNLNYATKCKLSIGNDKAYLLFNHEITSFELIQLQQNGIKKDVSDFEKELQNGIEINFTGNVDKTIYKAIGRFTIRTESGEDKIIKLVFNSLNFDSNREFLKMTPDYVSEFNTSFIVNKDENSNLFKMISN